MQVQQIGPDANIFQQALVSTADEGKVNKKQKEPGAPFIFDLISTWHTTLPTGESRVFNGFAMTAINSKTWKHLKEDEARKKLSEVINQGRFVNVVIENGIYKQIHIHPDRMEEIEKVDAWDIMLRFDPNSGYSWAKESANIGVGSVESEENYRGMIQLHSLGSFLKA